MFVDESVAFGFGMSMTESLSKLYEGSVNIKGEDQAALITDSKSYAARTEKLLKQLMDNPEQTMNSQEFIDMIQKADIDNKKINAERKKILKLTDQELQTTDIRIFTRLGKGEDLISAIKIEYGKTFKRFDKDMDAFPEAWLIIIIVSVVNSLVAGMFIGALGFAAGMAATAILVAPITEEIGRYIGGGSKGRSFSYAINVVETITYVMSSLTGGLFKGILVLIYRMLFSSNMHQINETQIQSARLRAIVDNEIKNADSGKYSVLTLGKNMLRHSTFNAACSNVFTLILHPLMLVWEMTMGRFRNADLYEATEIEHANSLFSKGLYETISLESIAAVAALPVNGGTINTTDFGGSKELNESFAELFKLA